MNKTVSPTMQDIPGIVGRGIDNYRRSLLPATGMAIVVIVVYSAIRLTAQSEVDDGRLLVAFLIDFAGLVVATVLALPWFRLALRVERDEHETPDGRELEWTSMLVGALFFWAGILLGIRYMVGIPSIFMLIWYGLFGFAVAAGERPGLRALGSSVRLGKGRRWTVALVAIVLGFINFLGLLPIGTGLNVGTALAALALLAATTNVSMGAGAHLYDWLVESETT